MAADGGHTGWKHLSKEALAFSVVYRSTNEVLSQHSVSEISDRQDVHRWLQHVRPRLCRTQGVRSTETARVLRTRTRIADLKSVVFIASRPNTTHGKTSRRIDGQHLYGLWHAGLPCL